MADEKNRKRDGYKPRPAERKHGEDAEKRNGEPTTRPHDKPRLSVESARYWPFDGVHKT